MIIRYRIILRINPHDNLKFKSIDLFKLKTKLVANSKNKKDKNIILKTI
jgi:hypothetical protein